MYLCEGIFTIRYIFTDLTLVGKYRWRNTVRRTGGLYVLKYIIYRIIYGYLIYIEYMDI